MEFFEWTSAAQTLMMQLFRIGGTLEEAINQVYYFYTVCLSVAGGLYVICLVFGGLGMHAMAKKQGIKHSFLGFLPFANTYYAGKLAGEANFFGQKMKRAGLYAMLVEMAYVALNAFYFASNVCLLPYHAEYMENDVRLMKLDPALIPENMLWMYNGMRWFSLMAYLLSFVEIVLFCVLYNALFRKYYARGPFMMTFLSAVLPLRGFVLFAVRNNDPVDYNEYMRRRAEEFARRSAGTPYGGYGGAPYNSGDRQAPPPSGNPSENPFSDFGGNSGAGGDPFEEFSRGNGGSDGSDKEN